MRLRAAGLVLVLGLMAGSAEAVSLTVDSGGILLGATGVVVGGDTYDVSFLDGTCAALFSGCDAVTDFAFQTQASATVAAQALLDQVFLDGPGGQFDTVPALTAGCTLTISFCAAIIPYARAASSFSEAEAKNFSPLAPQIDTIEFAQIAAAYDSGSSEAYVFARFSPAVGPTPVPEPATLTLLGLGSLGLGVYRRRRRG